MVTCILVVAATWAEAAIASACWRRLDVAWMLAAVIDGV